MGNPGPAGKEIEINNHYMTIGGKPVLPVMGEVHYVRYPKNEWQDILLKMKANGIDIVSTYVFWIYHEEIEGQFDWSGNRDLRAFLKLCQKDGLHVFVRIGPWCHGEVRNGGFPDWLLQKKYIHPRSNDPVFQHYVKQYFHQIGLQMKGLMYKDGGPVIGIQLENEYSGGSQGEKYIMWLKKTAIADGMDVPMYTVTGWGNASIPKDQVIPLWGGYPGAPWNPNLKKITDSQSFVFGDLRSSGNIFQGKTGNGYHPDTKIYPFFTVEMGVGNEITYHRRPVFSGIDGLSIAITRLGSGASLLGYYMFAGGADQVGTLTTLEEDRRNTGYWNRYPIISYDFQAAIRETGELAPSYYQIKKLHYFVNEFGSRLAPMMPVIGPQTDPHKNLLYSVRSNGESGYVFGVNYYRGFQKPTQKDVQFDIRLKGQRVKFPATPVNIPDSCDFIWPFNFHMNKVLLKYATAQPLCR
ncbi:MAG TPA: beta-galactosidase, partial [Balneolales bacterium]|nr:beta-galactosidase [Balneolales bacterium]